MYAHSLIVNYPDNILFRYYYYKALLNQNMLDEAEEQLMIIKEKSKSKQLNPDQQSHFIKIIKEELQSL